MSRFVETDAPVLSFCISDSYIFLLCGKELIKADKQTGTIISRKTIFKKDGNARQICGNGTVLAISDFCKLSIFRQDTLDCLGEWILGSDLSSDNCGLFMDEAFVYVCIRNGGITRIDLTDYSQATVEIGTASSWSLVAYQDKLIAGTVDGKLLYLDKKHMNCVHSLQLSRQNIKSLYIDGHILYAAGQDKKLYVIDLTTFTLIRKQSNLHKMMFTIIGVQDNLIYTVSHPCCEISVWNSDGTKKVTVPYQLRLAGSSQIDGDAILISSRNINGVDRIELSDMIAK